MQNKQRVETIRSEKQQEIERLREQHKQDQQELLAASLQLKQKGDSEEFQRMERIREEQEERRRQEEERKRREEEERRKRQEEEDRRREEERKRKEEERKRREAERQRQDEDRISYLQQQQMRLSVEQAAARERFHIFLLSFWHCYLHIFSFQICVYVPSTYPLRWAILFNNRWNMARSFFPPKI